MSSVGWHQVLVGSYNRFMEFVKRSNAVSPTITLETTAALQVHLFDIWRFCIFAMVLKKFIICIFCTWSFVSRSEKRVAHFQTTSLKVINGYLFTYMSRCKLLYSWDWAWWLAVYMVHALLTIGIVWCILIGLEIETMLWYHVNVIYYCV